MNYFNNFYYTNINKIMYELEVKSILSSKNGMNIYRDCSC